MEFIATCEGKECPLKASCNRYLMLGETVEQTKFRTPPFYLNDGVTQCKHYKNIMLEEV